MNNQVDLTTTDATRILARAKHILHEEQVAIDRTAQQLGAELYTAIELLLKTAGKVVISGVGKSGLIGKKIAASLSSTGTPAFFMHAAEAAHGDLGMLREGDTIILLSHSGNTPELLVILPTIKKLNIPIIAITGNNGSKLAQQADVVLTIVIDQEACSLNLAPTCSTTATLALGDCIALLLSELKQFKTDDFALFHPGGKLGAKLTLQVKDIMRPVNDYPLAFPEMDLVEVINLMTASPDGAINVVDNPQERKLLGIITEGDIRRALAHRELFFNLKAADAMTLNPVTVKPNALASQALELMENRPSQISVLSVVDDQHCALGILRIHDIVH